MVKFDQLGTGEQAGKVKCDDDSEWQGIPRDAMNRGAETIYIYLGRKTNQPSATSTKAKQRPRGTGGRARARSDDTNLQVQAAAATCVARAWLRGKEPCSVQSCIQG